MKNRAQFLDMPPPPPLSIAQAARNTCVLILLAIAMSTIRSQEFL